MRYFVSLRKDSSLGRWRTVAVGGATLSPALATLGEARLLTGPGMAADIEFRPPGPGE